jgi:hypothetical protein
MLGIDEFGFAATGSDVVDCSEKTAERDAREMREFAFRQGNFTAPANISEREVD